MNNPMAEAMKWVSNITVISFEMALPLLGGAYLDSLCGLKIPIFVLCGLCIGPPIAIWHLLKLCNQEEK
jgi:hypothetical protein